QDAGPNGRLERLNPAAHASGSLAQAINIRLRTASRGRFPRAYEACMSTPESENPDPHRTLTVGQTTSQRARLRVLRPHAKGGLGEVFVALDEELHREVALKEIQSQFAYDFERRARFVLEAEITGGLEHPGIVPVYGLGQYADGRPYYAMRFIR